MTTRISKRSAVAQGFAPFNSSRATHGINFGYALPDPVMFAKLPWPDAFDERTGVGAAHLPQYTDAAGLPELRTKLALRYGVRHDQVMLTGGASQALQLIADGWIDPGDLVLTEDPSYLGALGTFSIAGATVVQLGLGADGVDLNEVEAMLQTSARVKLFYTMPAFHNPTGHQMSCEHVAKLAALLARNGALLVQDLVYAELPYNAPVHWLAPGDNVINVHSISKVAGPGLRVGWVLAEPDIINRLAHLKRDGGVSPLLSNIVLGLLQSSALDSHITHLREHYRAKRDGVHTLLQRSRICEPEYSVPSGGFSFWVRLTAGTDPERFIEAASREHDVHLINGRNYGPRSGRHVRLCFSYLPISLIEQGLERLGHLHANL
ncbi:PLP-dependent aminotransferase family protein [Bradyrhizobium yuanmingense]|uniref:aminotransferase-like domain-containing protein n=1 Tax=Bradyrhizobium yuanmingense TaxID=108015 RepID=UPI0023B95F1C|nr:PLP-dependent aminotransferase family protein [Bradyrhizobium yuanmingense]MDF0582057.1 PLP-dependent aminotransferase family protein [Bradyrhizobium yuanmingense]